MNTAELYGPALKATVDCDSTLSCCGITSVEHVLRRGFDSLGVTALMARRRQEV